MKWRTQRLWLLGVASMLILLIPNAGWSNVGGGKKVLCYRTPRTNVWATHETREGAFVRLDEPFVIARRGRGHAGEFTGPSGGRDRMWRQRYREWESLSPERKMLLRERMEEWKRLSPTDRALMRKRYEQWKTLSPEEQIWIRDQLRRWNDLTPQEREMIRQMFMR